MQTSFGRVFTHFEEKRLTFRLKGTKNVSKKLTGTLKDLKGLKETKRTRKDQKELKGTQLLGQLL